MTSPDTPSFKDREVQAHMRGYKLGFQMAATMAGNDCFVKSEVVDEDGYYNLVMMEVGEFKRWEIVFRGKLSRTEFEVVP